jgi:diguanylate cyclase (GGDEF)-like protein
METATVKTRGGPQGPDTVAFARTWAGAILGTGHTRLTYQQVEALLCRLTTRLAEMLCAEPFTPSAGYALGEELVSADFAAAEALGRTMAMVNAHLLAALGLTGPEPRARLDRVVEALATGYARAIRDRTLDEQEAIRQAAVSARARAETPRVASEAKRRHAALHDPLTGLPNRACFTEWLRDRLGSGNPDARLAVCLLNLDRFDAVNDSLGHRVGDQLVITVAARLSALAGDGGHLLAHLGGDDFALLIEETLSADDAVKVADRAQAALREPVRVDGHHLPVTASIGIVEEPIGGTDPIELMRAAQMSLHWAKRDGKARWALFDRARGDRDVARYTLSAQLPGALARGEFTLLYQPLVDLADGRVLGVEALARWQHPVQGLIGPGRFIDLAEDTGLIVPLGLNLLGQACAQAAAWCRSGTGMPYVSVNLAVHQLRQPGLIDHVRRILDESGLPAEYLHLEITESDVIGTDEQILATLRALADLGVRLAIDDFGTGYANLAHLRTLPVHVLKLDASFVKALDPPGADPAGEAIVAALLSLGHTLGLSVTAEGVETATQAARLAEIGVDAGQGWYLGRPAVPARIAHRLAERAPILAVPDTCR